jgi:zinc protease
MNQLGQQTNSDRALQAAVDELYGLGYDHADGYPASIAAVTAGDVRRAARKYLTHHVLVRTGPKEK